MRYLIVSDIHGNWEALESVLASARGGYDEVCCLGDVVGYCADPNRVTDWIRTNVKAVVRGNHDKACAGLENLEWFNPIARQAALWTMQHLTTENLEWLRALPKGPLVTEEFEMFHGSPLDEDDYIVSAQDAAQLMGYLQSPVSFFGHTHLQGGFTCERCGVRKIERPRRDANGRVLELQRDSLYMINPGSVGQPRDGDPRTAWAVYDSVERLVEYRRAEYDVRACQNKILRCGLPELLAHRLEAGA
ncbi:MAG TPA: metallophosphoesterase family protein [Bryobacteraceae bacterium]|nr:metallophosphoesterase family protein [Bryobacteraceae bacterium]